MTSKLLAPSSSGSSLASPPASSAKALAAQNAWTLAYAEGYIEGQRFRRGGAPLAKYVLVGIDEYCLGFRAGHFATERKSSPARKIASK